MSAKPHAFAVFVMFLLAFPLVRVEREEEGEQCPLDDEADCTSSRADRRSKYSASANFPPRWLEYLRLMEEAERDYEGCDEAEECPCYDGLIDKDLEPFTVISEELLDRTRELSRTTVTYQILSGRVYRSPDCLFPARCRGVDHFLLRVAKRMDRDVEFVINNHDYPFVSRRFHDSSPLPLFSFSKTRDYLDVSYPAWSFWSGGPAIGLHPTGLGRWDLLRSALSRAARAHPWEDKEDVAFFRGSRTSAERDPIVRLSRKRPDLVDAAYTKNQAWKSKADTLGEEPAAEASLESHCRYRYLFNYRGVAASFRFKHLFLCGSLVLHAGEEWTEFFYPAMRPWLHYLPVPSGAGEADLEDLILFARSTPEASQRVAEAGRRFVERHLRPEDVECYWRRLLAEYSKLMDFRPVRRSGLVLVKEEGEDTK